MILSRYQMLMQTQKKTKNYGNYQDEEGGEAVYGLLVLLSS